MRYRLSLFVLFFALWILPEAVHGMTPPSALPWSFAQGLNVRQWERLPALDAGACLEEDREEIRRGLRTLPFSRNISLNLSPARVGSWYETNMGRVWLLGLEAPGSQALMAVLEDVALAGGVTLYVYNEDRSRLLGPFSGGRRRTVLPLEPVEGERLVLELNVPTSVLTFGNFRITQIGRVYRDLEAAVLKVSIDNASACHLDINCPVAAAWQVDKRSVVRIMVNKITRNEYGTGVLVNNTLGNRRPYVLTAAHVLGTYQHAERSLFFFGYESVACNGARGPKTRTIAGAELKATARTLDFSLMELSEEPPLIFEPYYAGWDFSGNIPAGVVGIHHPWADMKKLAIADVTKSVLTSTYSSSDLTCEDNAHWRVQAWAQGTTEPGSSGSPLFDRAHRVVGTLSGGASTCDVPRNDYYSKLSFQSNYFSTYDTARLRPWLDPGLTGLQVVDGYDPVAQALAHCDTVGHISDLTAKTLYRAGAKGYASGHNSLGTTLFAERFRSTSHATLYGALFHLSRVNASGLSKVTIKVWTGETFPETEVYTQQVSLQHFFPGKENLVVFDDPLPVQGNFFIGYAISYAFPADTFAVSQAPTAYAGLGTCVVNTGSGWREQAAVMPSAGYASLAIRAIGQNIPALPPVYTDVEDITTPDGLLIYPNPVRDQFTACFPGGPAREVFCYDALGRAVWVRVEATPPPASVNAPHGIVVQASGLPAGVYFLSVHNAEGRWEGRFIKAR
jgi:hypothetical protein